MLVVIVIIVVEQNGKIITPLHLQKWSSRDYSQLSMFLALGLKSLEVVRGAASIHWFAMKSACVLVHLKRNSRI